jgi:hypothetical protein
MALGTLGYVAYRYLEKVNEPAPAALAPPAARPDIPLAGGALSSQATLQHSADEPPAAAPAIHLPA